MGSKLKTYKLHFVLAGHAAEGERVVKCIDDAEALIECHKLLFESRSAEVWDGGRLVCRMSRAGSRAPEDRRPANSNA